MFSADFHQIFGAGFATLSTQATSSPDLTPIFAAVVAGIAGILGSILGKLPELINSLAPPKSDFSAYSHLPILQVRRRFLSEGEWNLLSPSSQNDWYSSQNNRVFIISGIFTTFIGAIVTIIFYLSSFLNIKNPFFEFINQNVNLISVIVGIVSFSTTLITSGRFLNRWINNKIGKGSEFLPLKFTEAYLLFAGDSEKLVGNALLALKYMRLEEIEFSSDEHFRWSIDAFIKEKNHYKYILKITITSPQEFRHEMYISFIDFAKKADWKTYLSGSEIMNRFISLAVLDLNPTKKSELSDNNLPKQGQK